MSELKAISSGEIYNIIEYEGSCITDDLYYPKSEADKVIAEQEKEARHHKYKRCMAMASEWRNYAAYCGMQSHCHNHRGFVKTAKNYDWKEFHAWKCVHRYKELAEKFKEVK